MTKRTSTIFKRVMLAGVGVAALGMAVFTGSPAAEAQPYYGPPPGYYQHYHRPPPPFFYHHRHRYWRHGHWYWR